MSSNKTIEEREAWRLVNEIQNSDVIISNSRDLSQYIVQHQGECQDFCVWGVFREVAECGGLSSF